MWTGVGTLAPFAGVHIVTDGLVAFKVHTACNRMHDSPANKMTPMATLLKARGMDAGESNITPS